MSVGSLPAAPAGRSKPRVGGERSRLRHGDDPAWRWATLTPSLAIMLALSVLPLLNLFWLSFNNVTWAGGVATWTPVGLTHYRAVFSDKLFQAGVWNTTIFAFGAVAGQMVLGFVMALFCSRITRGRVLYRALFILPILIPGIVIGAIWKLMLNYDFGLANQALGLVGLEPRGLAGRERDGAALRHPRRHLALDAVLFPAASWPDWNPCRRTSTRPRKIDGASGWQELAMSLCR